MFHICVQVLHYLCKSASELANDCLVVCKPYFYHKLSTKFTSTSSDASFTTASEQMLKSHRDSEHPCLALPLIQVLVLHLFFYYRYMSIVLLCNIISSVFVWYAN